jgi:cation diffusion facilitator CzcD-associated flavoprotein CzcO
MAHHTVDVVIIGAGPYGLSLASYLRHRGVERRIFGVPMQAWRQMPVGMSLKSFGFATSIPTPERHPTLPEYCRTRGLEDFEPIETATFAEYGEAFQRQLVPDVEVVRVTDVTGDAAGFAVTLETGERFLARKVIVAAGLGYFARIPEPLSSLPGELVTHASRTREYLATAQLAGRDVTIIGAGQSALEAAALVHEGGGQARLIARHGVWWSDRFTERSLRNKLLNPNTVIGPGRLNWVIQHVPMLLHYAPQDRRVRFTRRYLGPFGAWWLRDRVEGKVTKLEQTSIVAAAETGGRVRLRLRSADGREQEIETDHVIAGTGYEADVDRLPFLNPTLLAKIRRVERAPALSRHFQSSVPGLYFVGPVSAFSFGPLVRFVAGAAYTCPVVARHVARSLRSRVSISRDDRRSNLVETEPVKDR